ncbi:MAG: hypothetical protein COA36_02220 [Desulfotalea sp.]|nr:MAG: hypothetical protein COA36_02220 [Desulfotalea sp.]
MQKYDKKIESCIQQDPAYDCLDKLGPVVWKKIRAAEARPDPQVWFNLTLTPAIKALSLALLIGSCLALTQVSFERGLEPDLFDLHYFSHQSLATTNLLSSNIQGLFP